MAAMAQTALQNRKVTVNREKLIETLKANKTLHDKKYKESLIGYVASASQKLKEAFDSEMKLAEKKYQRAIQSLLDFDAQKPEGMPSNWEVTKQIVIHIPVPKNYSDMYSTAIEMMEWDTRTEVELTYAEFQCFVQDEWDWKEEFERVTTSYLGFAK